MGRLIWKFFYTILLAQCVATAALRGTFWPIVIALVASLLFVATLAWHTAQPIRVPRATFVADAQDFDGMSPNLRARVEHQKRLLHDVSHELLAPLARLQAALGLAQQQPEKHVEWMRCIEREGVRMKKLVGELLTFSRLDAAANFPLTQDVAVFDLIETIIADIISVDACSTRKVRISGCPGTTVRGSPELLCRAIDNVVGNAIKYGPACGTVEIDLRSVGSSVVMRVQDEGPGVAAEHLSEIFQPFFRSGSGARRIDSHGLGLSIAQRVVEAHGGSIKADNRESGGLCVTLTLPASAQRERLQRLPAANH